MSIRDRRLIQRFKSTWKAPSKFRKMYKNIESKKRRNYAATATAMDSMIGDVIELYKQFGYWDNTIVVFSSGIFQNVEFVPYIWPIYQLQCLPFAYKLQPDSYKVKIGSLKFTLFRVNLK